MPGVIRLCYVTATILRQRPYSSLLTSPTPNTPASSDQPQCCDWSLCRRDCCPQRRKAEKAARLLLTLVEEEGWEGVLSSARSPSSPVPDFCTSSDPSPSLKTFSSICWVVMCRFCRNSGNRNIDYLTPCPCNVLNPNFGNKGSSIKSTIIWWCNIMSSDL